MTWNSYILCGLPEGIHDHGRTASISMKLMFDLYTMSIRPIDGQSSHTA